MIRRSTNQLSIKPKLSPNIKIALSIGAILLAAIVIYSAHQLGVRSGHAQFNEDRQLVAQLNQTILGLREELANSQESLIIAQRHKQIQEEAYQQISSAYAGSEQKNRYLGSRLDFYRSIISPQDGKSGPAIQTLQVSRVDQSLKFEVTLVQAIRHKHQIVGKLKVEYYDGENLVGTWPSSSSRSVNFQYFQQVSGEFENAQSRETARFKVTLSLQSGDVLERWFDGYDES